MVVACKQVFWFNLSEIAGGATDVEIQDLIWEMETMKSIGRHVNIINLVGYCIQNEG